MNQQKAIKEESLEFNGKGLSIKCHMQFYPVVILVNQQPVHKHASKINLQFYTLGRSYASMFLRQWMIYNYDIKHQRKHQDPIRNLNPSSFIRAWDRQCYHNTGGVLITPPNFQSKSSLILETQRKLYENFSRCICTGSNLR